MKIPWRKSHNRGSRVSNAYITSYLLDTLHSSQIGLLFDLLFLLCQMQKSFYSICWRASIDVSYPTTAIYCLSDNCSCRYYLWLSFHLGWRVAFITTRWWGCEWFIVFCVPAAIICHCRSWQCFSSRCCFLSCWRITYEIFKAKITLLLDISWPIHTDNNCYQIWKETLS